METILGRAVHPCGLAALAARGVFARLHATADAVYVEPTAPGLLPRVAIAVRAGSDVLGYVWAVVTGPLSAERCQVLRQLMPLVALHLINARIDDTPGRAPAPSGAGDRSAQRRTGETGRGRPTTAR